MAAPVLPCCGHGETADDLRHLRNALESARYHAERIRAGADIGSADTFQSLVAAELAAEAEQLRDVLNDVRLTVTTSATLSQRAAA
ncbi:hypothetical protein OWC43_19235 [Methylorubrum sp. POS3]